MKSWSVSSLTRSGRSCVYIIIFFVVCNSELSNTAFIKGDKSKQFNVEIKYKKGADPVLSLLDESRTVVDTLA